MIDKDAIAATQQLVIRKPVSEVFQAFADPEVTTKFWFNRSTGPLASGANVEWYWRRPRLGSSMASICTSSPTSSDCNQ